ncbi:MAG TPA: polysaccharide deacetylase family protein [Bacteroidia bacterium]|jgi:peptidoglycan/xylan/chitin deacetylase (PgdA/CDA1 family)|nr:polysaccharide deacetylase family protein [Bacteroidia bacterium]
MLNFKTSSILFVLAVISIVTFHYVAFFSLWWLILPVLIYKAFIVYGSANINSNFYCKTYCEGTTTEKEIVLTFDDGPTAFTPAILETLRQHQAPATFFVIGKNIHGNEAVLKQTVAEGHTLGNHTFSHSFFIDFKNAKQFKRELNQTDDAVYNVTGTHLSWFRPPYGVTTPHLVKAAKQLHYKIIGWNIRSLDTTKDSEEVIYKRVTSQLKPGAIILFHDSSEKTNAVLKRTLAFAKEHKFKVVPLGKLLKS